MKVGWDLSHQEFSILDHYYFSKLKEEIEKRGKLLTFKKHGEWEKADVLIFNYPELPFKEGEIEKIIHGVEKGKRVIALGYYDDHDNVSSLLNDLLKEFGIKMGGSIKDKKSNFNKDPLFPLTSKVFELNEKVEKVVMPCPAEIKGGEKIVEAESGGVIASYRKFGKGEVIAIGSCVFWDNFSIELFDNRQFAVNLLFTKFKNGRNNLKT